MPSSPASDPSHGPVLLVHGLASSFEHNWRATGWTDILVDEGRPVIEMDLPGHGDSKADPATTPPAQAVLAAISGCGYGQVDAVGFSAGARALLTAAAAAPHRFRRIAVLGVGNPVPEHAAGPARLSDALESPAEPDAPMTRVLWRLAGTAGNDRRAVAAYLRAGHPGASLADLAAITLPVLVVLGDQDFAAPADQLLAALPDARLMTIPGVDHFGTPLSYDAISAVTEFLAAS
jgi:pimeloyl-ACP methyl ester carboxylesterase